ncbi:hypothetical protein FGIG_10774 [Fasciola gigantica]|uniref:AAA+ ATPase domain-containing protein n=1 Tax=Fasciola gigantica TaxID=46835 RepID=A0A504YRI7_FASGI|nr:hypothetical protein FGIG_10774 [Fasciola gigantica]
MPTDYKGFTGEFHLRTQYRSTASNASQISEAEQARMAAAFGTEINAPFIASKSSENSGIARDTFTTDLEKPSGTSDTAIRVNVKPTTPGTESPQCCCQCGFKFEKLTSAIWGGRIPRFLILGKPCTGKTALAKRMCDRMGCRLVSGTELVLRHLRESDHYGKLINRLMVSGRDLDDALMIQMITEELNSRECLENGFVIDDFPNYSEKSLSIGKQLEFLRSLNPGPEYIIEIQMPNDSQRARWDSVKIDMNSGTLYTDATYKLRPDARHLVPTCCVTIPDTGNAAQERFTDTNMLIKRFEELAESIENNNTFYHEVVEPQVRQWLETYYADMIITMDGDADMSEIFYPLPDLWADNPPRIAILGKPFTGKTTLARSLCTQWNCQLINATNIIQDHLKLNTPTGQSIREIFNSGADLSDNFVVSMLLDKLSSPGCTEAGYVLDGIPTHSEKSRSIASQLDFIRSLNPPPDYLILIEISDTALRERWEAVRIDVADGTLYTSRMFGHVGHHPGQPRGSCVRHADFPDPDETTRNRLITRHEELPENLDRHFQFYNANIAPQLRQFVASHDPSKVVTLDGEQSSNAMVNTLLYKLNVMARNPNVPTAELFVEPKQSLVKEDRFCKCPHHQQVQLEPLAELWLDKPPRVLIVGKPCTGKTTLAKRLCQLWKCELINASEMIQKVLNTKSERGKYVLQELTNGRDLNDQFILDLLCQAINSPAALDNGYILDGVPTHSEQKMSIPDQLQLIRNLDNSPDYIIEIQMSDENLRDRWEAIRIDVADGTLYSRLNYDRCSVGTTSGRRTRHPDFPIIDESTKERLLTRHEELAENLNRHFEFYSTRMEAPLRDYIASHDPSMVVRVKGDLAPSQLLQAVLIRLSIMSRHPGLDTSICSQPIF